MRPARLCLGVARLAAQVSRPRYRACLRRSWTWSDLPGFASQRADALSGGQRQRVGIARAIMQEPDIILADEPTSSLDPKTSVEIMEILQRFARERGIPVIVNIHNVELARRFASRIIGMTGGQRGL